MPIDWCVFAQTWLWHVSFQWQQSPIFPCITGLQPIGLCVEIVVGNIGDVGNEVGDSLGMYEGFGLVDEGLVFGSVEGVGEGFVVLLMIAGWEFVSGLIVAGVLEVLIPYLTDNPIINEITKQTNKQTMNFFQLKKFI